LLKEDLQAGYPITLGLRVFETIAIITVVAANEPSKRGRRR
jgi:hypothetical protein